VREAGLFALRIASSPSRFFLVREHEVLFPFAIEVKPEAVLRHDAHDRLEAVRDAV